jgi:hypothetical protein
MPNSAGTSQVGAEPVPERRHSALESRHELTETAALTPRHLRVRRSKPALHPGQRAFHLDRGLPGGPDQSLTVAVRGVDLSNKPRHISRQSPHHTSPHLHSHRQ